MMQRLSLVIGVFLVPLGLLGFLLGWTAWLNAAHLALGGLSIAAGAWGTDAIARHWLRIFLVAIMIVAAIVVVG